MWQTPNSKHQIDSNDQDSKYLSEMQSILTKSFGHLNLAFGICSGFGIRDLGINYPDSISGGCV
jgi:hypothetical protein